MRYMKSKRLRYAIATILMLVTLSVSLKLINNKPYGPNSYVGLTESQAITRARNRDQKFRIVRRDQEQIFITDDIQPDRINFEISNGVVTKSTQF